MSHVEYFPIWGTVDNACMTILSCPTMNALLQRRRLYYAFIPSLPHLFVNASPIWESITMPHSKFVMSCINAFLIWHDNSGRFAKFNYEVIPYLAIIDAFIASFVL
jgi:hypothetical protein